MNSPLPMLFVVLGLAAVTADAQKVTTIRQIDFDNFSYAWSGAEPPEDADQPWHWFASEPDQHVTAAALDEKVQTKRDTKHR